MRTTGRQAQLEATDRDAEAGAAAAGGSPAGDAVGTVQRVWQGRLRVQGRSPAQARAVLPGELHVAGPQPDAIRAPREPGTVRQQLRNYARLRALVEAWIAAGLELSPLRLEAAASRAGVRGRAAKRATSP